MAAAAPAPADKADATRRRILDAAAAVFRESGYAAASLRTIASAAGLQAGSIYYHFDSKQAIVTAILNAGIRAVHAEVARSFAALDADASCQRVIRACVHAHLRALFEFSDYTSANVRIYGQVPEEARKANRKYRRDYESLWSRILQHVVEHGGARDGVDLKAFRLLLIGSLNATLEWFDARHGDLAQLADSYADILLYGLAQRASTKA